MIVTRKSNIYLLKKQKSNLRTTWIKRGAVWNDEDVFM